MVFALFFFGAVQSGVSCAYLDISPNFSNTMNTVGNMVGAVAGIVGPIVVSICITVWEGRLGWQIAFFITAIMCIVALIAWAKWQTSDIVEVLNTPLKVS